MGGPPRSDRAPVGRPIADALQIRHQLRSTLVETGAPHRRLDRIAHLNVRGGKGVAGEPDEQAEFGFHQVEVF